MQTYGCHNHPREPSYVAPDRQYHGKSWTDWQRTLNDTSSKECRYDMRKTDPKCEGCTK